MYFAPYGNSSVILKGVDGSESIKYKEDIKTGMYWTQKKMLLVGLYRPVQVSDDSATILFLTNSHLNPY